MYYKDLHTPEYKRVHTLVTRTSQQQRVRPEAQRVGEEKKEIIEKRFIAVEKTHNICHVFMFVCLLQWQSQVVNDSCNSAGWLIKAIFFKVVG